MPPPYVHPNSPRPKNSPSALLGAFKSLTGQKKSESSSNTASAPDWESPTSADHVYSPLPPLRLPSGHGPTESATTALNGEHASANFALDEDSSTATQDLEALAVKLSHHNDPKSRQNAAMIVIAFLAQHKIDNAGTIWRKASDLLDEPTDSSSFQVALNLYTACIQQEDLTGSDRRIFFDTLSKQLIGCPRECIKCFGILTAHGRYFDGLDMLRATSLMSKLVKVSSEAASEARKRIRKGKSGSSAPEDACLEEAFDLMTDSLKFSSNMFVEGQLEMILSQVYAACKNTSLETEVARALRVVDAVITYCVIPSQSLRPLLELLCGLYSGVDSPNLSTNDLLWKIMKSYHASASLVALQAILVEGPKIEGTMIHSLRGAVKLLHQIVVGDEGSLPVELTLSDFVSAMSRSLSWLDVRLERIVLEVLRDLMKRPEVFSAMLADEVWPRVVKLLERCASSEAMRRCRALDPSTLVLDQKDSQNGVPENPHADFSEAYQSLTRSILQNAAIESQAVTTPINSAAAGSVDDRRRMVMPMLLGVASYVDEPTLEAVLCFYEDVKLHVPPHLEWLDTCRSIQRNVFQDKQRPTTLRVMALKLLKESYSIAVAFDLRECECLLTDLLPEIEEVTHPELLQPLVTWIVEVATWTNNLGLFDILTGRLQDVLLQAREPHTLTLDLPTLGVPSYIAGLGLSLASPPLETPAVLIARGLVRIFLRTVHKSYPKSDRLYNKLLSIAQSSDPSADARITALKVLVRLRGDIYHGVFVVPRTESETLAAALCRTADSAVLAHINADSPLSRPVRTDETPGRRRDHGNSSSNNSLSRSNSAAGGGSSHVSKLTKARPPLWMYPGPKGIPEEPYYYASHVTYTHLDQSESGVSSHSDCRGTLDIGLWLEAVIQIINSPSVDWEIFSYVIVHLGGQLGNHALFVNAIPQIKCLRRVICEKLNLKNYIEPPGFTSLKKSDAAVCLYQILTMLISYSDYFSKDDEQDAVVKAFVLGIASWERTSEICIHGLTICCHEMPSVLARYLDTALHKMTQIITQTNVAASILEFLATLARLPELFRNFREEEFKTVFGICFRYLQYVHDMRDKQSMHGHHRTGRTAVAGMRASRDPTSPVEHRGLSSSSLGEALPQYVYALTFHVMTFWFMALKLQDRPKHVAWIAKNLNHKEDQGADAMDEQAQVTIDMMLRVSYSDRDETTPDPNFAQAADGNISSRNYLFGTSILSVETAGRTGLSQLTMRRPSGTTAFIYRPLLVRPSRHQAATTIGLAADAYSADYVGVTPEHIIQTLYSPFYTNPDVTASDALPLALPDDDATRRAISTFDRIPALDGHKAGIIYVGEGQMDEAAILANVMGSADYVDFLNGIGTLTELKGATLNTQGLDREYDSDGKFTYCWRDRVSELVFHVTTMMPTNTDNDPRCSLKKRHIGNDFVNIIFNNSGMPFDFDTFPSDYNYVNIVITPEARASFVETRFEAARFDADGRQPQLFYKVTVMTKPGLPKISPAAETKIISGTSLPAFVRLITLNASVFSSVWANHDTGASPSSWKSRLVEIKRLRARHASTAPSPWAVGGHEVASPPPTASSAGEQPVATHRKGELNRRASAATLLSDSASTKRSSGFSAYEDREHD